jgi:quinol monooxygenase YgiN
MRLRLWAAVPLVLSSMLLSDSVAVASQPSALMVRLSEIEIAPQDLAAYQAILKEEAAASVRLEPGVIAIFPMYQQAHPTQVRILEVYANRAAYEAHVQSAHFLRYKTATLSMVKSLQLVDMTALDAETMARMFVKRP